MVAVKVARTIKCTRHGESQHCVQGSRCRWKNSTTLPHTPHSHTHHTHTHTHTHITDLVAICLAETVSSSPKSTLGRPWTLIL